MDKNIIGLAEENKLVQLTETLESISNDQLCQMIEQKILKGRNDMFTLVRAILLGSPSDNSACVYRRTAVYKQCISSLQKNDMNSKMVAELIAFLMLEADTLPGPALAELAGLYVDGIKSDACQLGKALDLLPKILSAIASKENIVFDGKHMKGIDYKGHVLNSLCSCRWEPGIVIHLASMFRDVPLSSDELKFVIEKILRMFKELDVGDIPALVYQVLLLSTKGHKKLVLEGIINFFTEQDKLHKPTAAFQEISEDLLEVDSHNIEALQHTEGTVILHVIFAIKQQQDLGREFIKCLKGYQNCCVSKVISPFSLALTLSLSRIQRFEDQIFDFLKAMILKGFKDMDKQHQSSWVKEIVPDVCCMEESVLQVVQNSTFGWDHVVQGLVQLGFILMDSFGPKAAFGRTDVLQSLQVGPIQQACQLGAKILLKTFKAHEMVSSEILEQIFNRVITKAASPVSHFLDLLGDIVFASPQMLLDTTAKVHEMFDYLSFLSVSSAEGLLKAIQPLLKLSISLKDSLILVLRKAMFSRQLDARKIGASGFLMILKHFRVLGGISSSQSSQSSFLSSQIAVDLHISYNASSNEALCLEILGNLRRCLLQQADVRLLLYQSVVDVLDRNSQLKDCIFGMLMTQLKGYYESNESINCPLKLEKCILAQGDQVYLAEPLAHLLCCIQLCLMKSSEIRKKNQACAREDDDDEGDDHSVIESELEKIMKSLTQKMLITEMEDFELDKSAEYSLSSSVGVRNNIFAILVLGTYEALMEYTVMSEQLSEASVQQLLQLFEGYRKLSDVLKEKAGSGAGKKNKGLGGKVPRTLLSLKVVTYLLEILMSDSEEATTLHGNSDFVKYVLTVAYQLLTQIQDKGQCDGVEGRQKGKIYEYICKQSHLLLGFYIQKQKSDGEQRVRDKQVLTLTLECLGSTVTIAMQQYSKELTKFLTFLETDKCKKKSDSTTDDEIYKHIKKVEKLIMNIFSASEDNPCWKDVGLLLNIIFQLSKSLSTQFTHCEDILSWLQNLCKEQSIDDLSLCKSMLSSLLAMAQKWKSSLMIIRELSQDVHCQIGDIDQEIEMASKTNFALVTTRTASPTILQILLEQCEKELDDTEWVVTRVKADTAVTFASQTADDSILSTQREQHEKSICMRLGVIVTVCHELIQTALPIGPSTEQLLKLMTHLYGTLTMLAKYYLSLYMSGLGSLSLRFEKLVKLSGTHLTQYCYAFITYIQALEAEKIQQAAPDKGKKKKSEKTEKKKNGALQTAKNNVMKQQKNIPNLVFAIEQYERYLIQLTKKSKINLMEHMKNSTSRDFRINASVLENQGSSGSSDDDDDDSDDECDDISTRKTQDETAPERTFSRTTHDSDQKNKVPSVSELHAPAEPAIKKSKLAGKKPTKKSKA